MAILLQQNYEPSKPSKNSNTAFDDAHVKRRPSRNDKLESIRKVSEMSNQYLQDEYVPHI